MHVSTSRFDQMSGRVNNYRPISMISNIAKIFEKIIYSRIYTYIFANNVMSFDQFVNVGSKGTKNASNYINNVIYNNVEESNTIIITTITWKKMLYC